MASLPVSTYLLFAGAENGLQNKILLKAPTSTKATIDSEKELENDPCSILFTLNFKSVDMRDIKWQGSTTGSRGASRG